MPTNSYATAPPAPSRSDITGVLGMRLVVSEPVTVRALGRHYSPGHTQDHRVSLWLNDGAQTRIAYADVLAATASDASGFKWAPISPVVIEPLSPGSDYRLVCYEVTGGDDWQDAYEPDLQPVFTALASCFLIGGPDDYPATNGISLTYTSPALLYGDGASIVPIVQHLNRMRRS